MTADGRSVPAPDPRIPADLRGYDGRDAVDAVTPDSGDSERHQPAALVAAADPLGWCVIATTALLTWLVGPVVLALFAAVGVVKYGRAWRAGRTDSNCLLGDVRLVMLYLAILCVIGGSATVLGLLR